MERVAEAGGAALGLLYGGEDTLTPRSSVAIDYLPPPSALQPYVTTLFHFRCDDSEIRDIQPADVGKLMLVLKGTGQAEFREDERVEAVPQFSLQSPTTEAVPFRFEQGFHSVGAALTPLGWAALSGLPADEHKNAVFACADHFGGEAEALATKLVSEYAEGRASQADMVEQLCAFIAGHLRKVSARHQKLIAQVVEWLGTSLDPELDALYSVSAYSTRQTQRLVERYFGLNPRALKRKYRAVRAAAILSAPELEDDRVAAVAEHFYDQSHLIREIGLFVGRTPSRLSGDDDPILKELLDVRNFRMTDEDDAVFDPKI